MASRKSTVWLETQLGCIYHDDSLNVMACCNDASIDMILTSPPFALTREKGLRERARGCVPRVVPVVRGGVPPYPQRRRESRD